MVAWTDGQAEGVYLVVDVLQTVHGPVARLFRVQPAPQGIAGTVPLDRVEPKATEAPSARDVLCLIALRDLERPWSGPSAAAFSCRTDFKPYQFRPLLKYFGEAGRRLLIADETGLGKTIEAGYILAEEVARSGASRILVLCPPRLRQKWRAEMWRRFGLPFQAVGSQGLMDALEDPGTPFLHIASMECGRRLDLDRIKRLGPDPIIDVLVIDEVHRMIGRGEETLRRELGIALACLSRGVVALSATPVHLELSDLQRVLDVVSPGALDPEAFSREMQLTALVNRARRILASHGWNATLNGQLRACVEELAREAQDLPEDERARVQAFVEAVRAEGGVQDPGRRGRLRQMGAGSTLLLRMMNRTRAVEVGEDRKRIVLTRRVSLSSVVREAFQGGARVSVSEDSLYHEVDRLLKESFSHVHRRQLSSSLPAMVGLLRTGTEGYAVWQARVHGEEEAAAREPTRRLSEAERTASGRLADLYGLLGRDSKLETLAKILRELKESCRKAIVFTHWIPTYRHLVKRLHSLKGIPVVPVAPGSGDEDVGEAVRRFQRQEGFAVLLATDLLREGLDLDAADCVVNYDLPYNPQEIEQRIGRVDRVGQASKEIRVVNLLVERSLDEEIYDRVLSRIGVFEHVVGDMRPIVQEMAVELELRGTIDEGKVLRTLSQLEDRQLLMEHEAFLAVEDALDEDIRSAHKASQGGLAGLHWTVLARCFALVCPRCACAWDRPMSTLTVEGLTPEAEEAILDLAGPSDRQLVAWAMDEARGDDGMLKIRLGGGRGSLPMTHPLVGVALDVVSKCLGGTAGGDRKARLLVQAPLPGAGPDAWALSLIEYTFEGEHVRERRWSWWVLRSDGAASLLDDSRAPDVLDDLAARAEADPDSAAHERSKDALLRASEADFTTWAEERARREASLRRISLAASIRTERFRLLRGLLGGGPEGDATTEVLRRKVESMEEELGQEEGLESFLRFVPMAGRQLTLTVRAGRGA